jgi:hypothetical protein
MTIRWKCVGKGGYLHLGEGGQGCYVEKQLPDWAMLDGCFTGTTVRPSDVDGFVHQNGKCLFIEKKFPRACIEPPQLRAIDTLVYQGNSVIAIWCTQTDGSDISKMRVWGIPGYPLDKWIDASLDDFRCAANRWWRLVYSGKFDRRRSA